MADGAVPPITFAEFKTFGLGTVTCRDVILGSFP